MEQKVEIPRQARVKAKYAAHLKNIDLDKVSFFKPIPEEEKLEGEKPEEKRSEEEETEEGKPEKTE